MTQNASLITRSPSTYRRRGRPQRPRPPRRIALLNDYVSVPFANGSSFASQFLYRELGAAGANVTVVGPSDPEASDVDLPKHHLLLDSLPLRSTPGVFLSMPTRRGLRALDRHSFDLVLAQTSNALMDVGVWLRERRGVPLVMVNTLHLASAYNTLLPDYLDAQPGVHRLFREHIVPFAERQTVDAYNRGDGLVVLSSGLKRYWRERGVRVPIHVIPRAIDEQVFCDRGEADPFPQYMPKGGRILVVCRHVREKNLRRLLRIFSRVAERCAHAHLTLVGDGPEHAALVEEATRLGLGSRVFFVGERPLGEIARWYHHADVFAYTSLSETYGQVVSEAMWCGLPVVAFADDKGVSDQLRGGAGRLIDPTEPGAEEAFTHALGALLEDEGLRSRAVAKARASVRARAGKDAVLARYGEVFESAKEHCRRTRVPGTRGRAILGRWAGMHAIAYALGLLRPRARVARAPRRAWSASKGVG